MVDVLPHTLIPADKHCDPLSTVAWRGRYALAWRSLQWQPGPERALLDIHILERGSRVGLGGTFASSPALDWLETRFRCF
jgi:hypothetical protein